MVSCILYPLFWTTQLLYHRSCSLHRHPLRDAACTAYAATYYYVKDMRGKGATRQSHEQSAVSSREGVACADRYP